MLTFSGCRLLFIQDADNETITVLLSFPSIVRAARYQASNQSLLILLAKF